MSERNFIDCYMLNENVIDGISKEFNCPICNNFCIKAVIDECGHTFCKECISGWLER